MFLLQVFNRKWEVDRGQLLLIQRVGEGIYSEVWKGLWINTVPIAVKTLKPGTKSVSEYLAQADIMKELRHEHLLQLYAKSHV